MAIQPALPQSVGGVLDTAFQLFKASFAKVWLICLLAGVGSNLPSWYLLVTVFGNPTDPAAALELAWSPEYWLVTLLGIGTALWMMGATYLKLNSIGVGTEIGVDEALRSAAGRLLVLLVMAFLFSIALLAGFVLLIVPGLILMVSLILCFNLALFDGKGPIASLTGSHKLVWGNWWRASTILGVGFTVGFVLYLAIALAGSLVLPLIDFGATDLLTSALLSGAVISVVVGVVVTPFYVALLISLYWDLKLRSTGDGLAARVDALEIA